MIASEFSTFADELVMAMSRHLPGLASEFFQDEGRGAVVISLFDSVIPEERVSEIYYRPESQVDSGDVAGLTAEYDPKREVVLLIQMDAMRLCRRYSFATLNRLAQTSQALSE